MQILGLYNEVIISLASCGQPIQRERMDTFTYPSRETMHMGPFKEPVERVPGEGLAAGRPVLECCIPNLNLVSMGLLLPIY